MYELTEGVGILGRHHIVANLSVFRNILAIVRLETIIVFEACSAANLFLCSVLVVVARQGGLARLELGISLVTAHARELALIVTSEFLTHMT